MLVLLETGQVRCKFIDFSRMSVDLMQFVQVVTQADAVERGRAERELLLLLLSALLGDR